MRARSVTSLAFAVALTLAVAACSSGGTSLAPTAGPTSTTAQASRSPGAGTGTATSTIIPARPSPTSSTPAAFSYVPLWPFSSVAAAEQWQRDAAAAGRQPWHLDAGVVAVNFTRQYLGFTGIDRVVRKRVTANDAHVTVGWTMQGQAEAAAVIHLVRIGSGTGRPWEVVGTDDTAGFSLTRPRYGSTVSGTITAGGHIAGVDENIRVTARQLSGTVGSSCCLPAGASAPWSVQLRLTRAQQGPITIVASTGGHIAAVERFTITGVRSGQ